MGRTVDALKTMLLLSSLKTEDIWTKWSGESSFLKVEWVFLFLKEEGTAMFKIANLAPTLAMSLFSSARYGCLLVLRGAWGEGGRR